MVDRSQFDGETRKHQERVVDVGPQQKIEKPGIISKEVYFEL